MMANTKILSILRLSRRNAATHLTPLVLSGEVGQLHVVREEPLGIESEKVVYHIVGRGRRFPRLLRLFRTGLAVSRAQSVDVLVGLYLIPYGLLAWLLARSTGRPVVLGLLGTDFNVHCFAWYGSLLRAILRRADAVTVTGKAMLDQLASWGVARGKLRVLPHAVDVERFRSETPADDRGLHLLYVGRLIRSKRVDLALRVFARVRERFEEARLTVLGDGPERTRLEGLARELGIRGSVTFAGYRDDVERFYGEAGVLLLASEREGLPLVLIEAMSCGCVPISTRCGTVEDLIESGKNGFLVEIGDWEAMAGRVLELLSQPGRLAAMSKAAVQVRERYAYASAVATWDRILSEIRRSGASVPPAPRSLG
ncbi:MAG: glycosyltransferase [Gemmatimonadota bacterium]|nr:MAG: glycosyltransferase [Gemmatimonadota bacterium]